MPILTQGESKKSKLIFFNGRLKDSYLRPSNNCHFYHIKIQDIIVSSNQGLSRILRLDYFFQNPIRIFFQVFVIFNYIHYYPLTFLENLVLYKPISIESREYKKY